MHVNCSHFEGPLSLLVYLIRKKQMDILNINISLITDEYLSSINYNNLNLDIASEFIVMAATLIQIKSNNLLPKELQEEVEEKELTKEDLVKRLIEHEKYQKIANKLNNNTILFRDQWVRNFELIKYKSDQDQEISIGDDIMSFAVSYLELKPMKSNDEIYTIKEAKQNIFDRIVELKNYIHANSQFLLDSIFNTKPKKSNFIITFLSFLELTKLGFTRILQNSRFGKIYIYGIKDLDTDNYSLIKKSENSFNYTDNKEI